jgi:RNA recognition motif-containing protein
MVMNPSLQKNKGFAFIHYLNLEDPKRALAELKDAQVKGKRCGVSPSQDNDTLYMGNICET